MRSLAPCLSIACDRSCYVFRSLALCLSIALDRFRCLSIALDVFRSLPMSHAMSADRCRCLTRCLQIATDRCRCLTRYLQIATDRCRCLTRCLQIATDRCRCLQIAANVDRYVNPWPVGLTHGCPAASPRQDRLGERVGCVQADLSTGRSTEALSTSRRKHS